VKPGFVDDSTRFWIEYWAFDVVHWADGFVMSATMHGPDMPHWDDSCRWTASPARRTQKGCATTDTAQECITAVRRLNTLNYGNA
jgi:hypothetical protein